MRRKSARQPPLQNIDDLAAGHASAVIELTEFRDPLDECAADSTRGVVRHLINGLPAHYARILELRFGDELTLAEIAQVLRMSERAAESLLVRARQAFKNAWLPYEATDGAATLTGREAP